MPKAYLHSSITNSKIATLVEMAASLNAENAKLKLGDVLEHDLKETVLKTKVWGFTRDRAKLILEVIINGVPIKKVVLGKHGGYYRISTNPHFIADYKRLVGITA